ncbi:MAG: ribosome biogenesis/translation initiation ATPase RLI [Candidatus Methanospirareceae archaeon]
MRIAVLKRDRCQPKKCNYECMKYCPMVRTGKETVVIGEDEKPIISEELCEGCGICVKKCPFEAIFIVGLPTELKGEETHRYGKNGFVLYGLPIPKEGQVIGIIGENGTGKSTTVKILSGLLVPNLGKENGVGWDEIIKNYAGSELQIYLEKLSKGKIKVAYKPQYIEKISRFFSGKVSDLLESTDETSSLKRLVKAFEMEEAMERDISEISGGELQRVAVIACMIRDADVYFFDEITPYLDIYQRVNVAKGIKEFLAGKTVVVVEHDLAILDMLADFVHIIYGKPGVYGVVTMPKGTNRGINEYLSGFLHAENIRIRDKPIEFSAHLPREKRGGSAFIEYGDFVKRYDGFVLYAKGSSIDKGEVLGIVGRNAIGKSTFVKVLAGEIEPSEGRISLPVKISYKPQYIRGDIDKTVKEYLISLKGGLSEADFVEILEPLDIKEIEEKKISELSGGELQRAAIAACLCQEASLYIFDEPSAHLDVEQKIKVMKTIRRYAEKRGVSMMVVDHDIYLIDLLSDRLMVFSGEPSVRGEIKGPFEMREGMNLFLKDLGITFRRDEGTLRPRINKIGSAKDREQKEKGEYYYDYGR